MGADVCNANLKTQLKGPAGGSRALPTGLTMGMLAGGRVQESWLGGAGVGADSAGAVAGRIGT